MALSEKEHRERVLSGLVYELWGTDPDGPEVKLPDMLFQDDNWDLFETAVLNRAGSVDEEEIAAVLHDLDNDLGDEIWWLIGEDDEEEVPPPNSVALWLVDLL